MRAQTAIVELTMEGPKGQLEAVSTSRASAAAASWSDAIPHGIVSSRLRSAQAGHRDDMSAMFGAGIASLI
jgi:hypothetical protein